MQDLHLTPRQLRLALRLEPLMIRIPLQGVLLPGELPVLALQRFLLRAQRFRKLVQSCLAGPHLDLPAVQVLVLPSRLDFPLAEFGLNGVQTLLLSLHLLFLQLQLLLPHGEADAISLNHLLTFTEVGCAGLQHQLLAPYFVLAFRDVILHLLQVRLQSVHVPLSGFQDLCLPTHSHRLVLRLLLAIRQLLLPLGHSTVPLCDRAFPLRDHLFLLPQGLLPMRRLGLTSCDALLPQLDCLHLLLHCTALSALLLERRQVRLQRLLHVRLRRR
mmetsp:Transcript_56933/g.101648  ORF Transcript_56933/g.101648 Transcript_56933/m.101648 type:complete len:272 (-) Transcript_56933:250-1065(-)